MTPDVKVVTSRAILKETSMILDDFVENHNDDGDVDDNDDGGDDDGQPGGEVDQERQGRDTFAAVGLYDVCHLRGQSNMYTKYNMYNMCNMYWVEEPRSLPVPPCCSAPMGC